MGNKIINRLTPSSTLTASGDGQWGSANLQPIGTGNLFPLRTYSAVNLAANFVKVRSQTTTAANSISGIRFAATQRHGIQWEGSNSGAFLQFTFTIPVYNSGMRLFIGYQSSQSNPPIAATARIDSVLDMVWLGKDVDDTNLQFMINNASGTASRVNTGIVPSVNNVYRFSIFINSDCSTVRVSLEEITRTTSSMVATTSFIRGVDDLPALGQQSYPAIFINAVATSTAVTVDIINGYEELLTL
jgi:hypothetical protein